MRISLLALGMVLALGSGQNPALAQGQEKGSTDRAYSDAPAFYAASGANHEVRAERFACKRIRQACVVAGYKPGGAFDDDGNPDNGLGRDCMSDLLLGRSVPNLTLSDDQKSDLASCQKADHPCLLLIDACDQGNGPKGCVKAIANGQTPAGVTAPAPVYVQECKAAIDRHQANHRPPPPKAAPPIRPTPDSNSIGSQTSGSGL